MAILQNQLNTDNSPWYDIMEERAVFWNKFTLENNLIIEGFYNANIVTFEIEKRKLKVSGIRQNTNIGTIMIGMNDISEELNISYETPIRINSKYIRIKKSKIWNFLRTRLKYKMIYKNYFVTYNNETEFENLKNLGLFGFKKLVKLTIDKNGVKLVLYELPESSEIIDSFLKFCNTLK